jgi:hypothetical protein
VEESGDEDDERLRTKSDAKYCTSGPNVHFVGNINDVWVGKAPGIVSDDGTPPVVVSGSAAEFAAKCKGLCERADTCEKWSFWHAPNAQDSGGHCYFFPADAIPKQGRRTTGGVCNRKKMSKDRAEKAVAAKAHSSAAKARAAQKKRG